MLLSEFENLTDIYPDVNLYCAIEHEYNEGDWHDKAEFCTAYKFNEDGLATRLQAAANQRLIDTEEQHRRDVNTAQRREERLYNDSKEITKRFDHVMEENKRLHEVIQDLKEENESLREEHETMERTVQQVQEIVQMFRVLEGYARDDVGVQDIGRAVVAFVDLLDRKAVERNV